MGLRDLKGCRGWDKGTRVLGGEYIQTTQGMNLPVEWPTEWPYARCYNGLRLPPNVTLVLCLPRNVTVQRHIPCTSHQKPRSNTTTYYFYMAEMSEGKYIRTTHVHKRQNFTCTSDKISRVQATWRPILGAHPIFGNTQLGVNIKEYLSCHHQVLFPVFFIFYPPEVSQCYRSPQ